MARSLEQERAAIEDEERRLEDRRKRLAEKERGRAMGAIEKSGLLKLDPPRLDALMILIGKLGIEEVERRLSS